MDHLHLCYRLREIPQISCPWSLVCAWKKANLTRVSILCWSSRGVLWQEVRAMPSRSDWCNIQKPLQKFLEICREDIKGSRRCVKSIHPFVLFDLLVTFLESSLSKCPSQALKSSSDFFHFLSASVYHVWRSIFSSLRSLRPYCFSHLQCMGKVSHDLLPSLCFQHITASSGKMNILAFSYFPLLLYWTQSDHVNIETEKFKIISILFSTILWYSFVLRSRTLHDSSLDLTTG